MAETNGLPTEDRRQSIVTRQNNQAYVIAVLLMMMLGVSAIVLITILHDGDNTGVITTIIGFLGPTTLSLLTFMKSQETHLSVNSRLDQFMTQAQIAARAQGIAEGRKEGLHEAVARTPPPSVPPSSLLHIEAPVVVVSKPPAPALPLKDEKEKP